MNNDSDDPVFVKWHINTGFVNAWKQLVTVWLPHNLICSSPPMGNFDPTQGFQVIQVHMVTDSDGYFKFFFGLN